jgi:hypothetical protein
MSESKSLKRERDDPIKPDDNRLVIIQWHNEDGTYNIEAAYIRDMTEDQFQKLLSLDGHGPSGRYALTFKELDSTNLITTFNHYV